MVTEAQIPQRNQPTVDLCNGIYQKLLNEWDIADRAGGEDEEWYADYLPTADRHVVLTDDKDGQHVVADCGDSQTIGVLVAPHMVVNGPKPTIARLKFYLKIIDTYILAKNRGPEDFSAGAVMAYRDIVYGLAGLYGVKIPNGA